MAGDKNKSEEILEQDETRDDSVHQEDETLIPLDQLLPGIPDEKSDAQAGAEDDNEKPVSMAQALQEQKQAAAENLEKALRAHAELENFRKRSMRDIENAHKYALEKFLGELLPVMDSMELGLSAASDSDGDVDSLKEGLELTHKMLVTLLEKNGIRIIDPAGEKFDPRLHEAVSMQEQEGTGSGQIISVMQKGYELNGRLLRPAMVVVAK